MLQQHSQKEKKKRKKKKKNMILVGVRKNICTEPFLDAQELHSQSTLKANVCMFLKIKLTTERFKKYVTCKMTFFIPLTCVTLSQFYSITSLVTNNGMGKKEDFLYVWVL